MPSFLKSRKITQRIVRYLLGIRIKLSSQSDIMIMDNITKLRKKVFYIIASTCLISSMFFSLSSWAQTPEDMARFNQLSPQQRQQLLSRLEGSGGEIEEAVTQPVTSTPRSLQNTQRSVQNPQRSVQNYEGSEPFYDEPQNLRFPTYPRVREINDFSLEEGYVDGEEFDSVQQDLQNGEYDIYGFDLNGYDIDGYDIYGYDEYGYDENGYDIDGLDQYGEPEEEELQKFGYDLFAGMPTTFAPATNIPVPLNYIIGPGDTVVLQFYGQNNERNELAVTREGLLQFPELGPLSVAGLEFDEMRELIQDTVESTLIGQQVSITMGRLRSIQVFVLGEAYIPGAYTLSALSTMTNAIFSSGGLKEVGSLRSIRLMRQGELVAELDLYDLLLRGDISDDVRLQPNDVIFIPPVGRTIGIGGDVIRPAIYELRDETSLSEILPLAGGFLATAYPSASRIERINTLGQRTLVDVDLTNQVDLDREVNDGDVLRVYSVLDQVEGIVSLEGHVNRPGGFAWQDGMRVTDIISRIGDMRPNPELDYALIVREQQPSRRIEVLYVNLGEAITNPSSDFDMQLQEQDRLIVFGENEDREMLLNDIVETLANQSSINEYSQLVNISGNVRFPGTYPLVKGLNIGQLIEISGGMTQQAERRQAEVTRFSVDSENGREAEHFIVNLLDESANGINTELIPFDRVIVRQISNWTDEETVVIGGEVNSPGTYSITKDDSLSDLIARAGGLTEYADAKAGIFLRQELKEREQVLLDEFSENLQRSLLNQSLRSSPSQIERPEINEDIMEQLLTAISEAKATGRLVVDFPALIPGKNINEDVILRDGDEILFPRTRQEVSVIGEVQRPTSHLYAGESLEEYIDRSGGYTTDADEKGIYIIKSSGEVIANVEGGWLFSRKSNIEIEPGDSIIVPYDADLDDPLYRWVSVSSVLFNLATTVLAIESVSN